MIINKSFGDDWSGEVKTKWKPSEGLFSDGSAEKIANEVYSGHNNDLKSSISSINFYINRSGDNLSSERKKVLERAKELIRLKSEKSNFSLSFYNSLMKLNEL